MPGKTWDQLSPAYRARLSRNGITAGNYGKVSAAAARGHAATPERPERALRNPSKYEKYLSNRGTIARQVTEKKLRLFGERLNFNAKRSEKNARLNPVTKHEPSLRAMRKFLAMDDALIDEWLDEVIQDDDFAFIFYK